ncbi:MAG: efflux RND transporter periplasmic adaptor subunit [Betaproteobacteria bacterium]
MNKTARDYLAATIAALVIVTAAGCGKTENAQSAKPEHAADKAPAHTEAGEAPGEHTDGSGAIRLSDDEIRIAGITVEALQPQDAPEELTLTATIQANQDRLAHVAPRVAGRVVKVNVGLGAAVKRGQQLALLDSIELGEARSAYRQASSEASLAQANFKRAAQLNEEQIIAQKDFLQARYENEKTQAALRAAREKLRLLGTTPEAAPGEEGGSVFPLTAPFAGNVIEKHAILGELGDPADSLFTIADLSTVWIEASVYEKDLAKIRVGLPASITVAAYPSVSFKGRVAYLGSIMDKETRTVSARIEAANSDGRLKPEMFATAVVEIGGAKRSALTLPEAAVVLLQGLPTIFVATPEGFISRPVATDGNVGGRLVVKSGVAAGERVVIAGAYALKARLLKSQISDEH